MGFSLNGNSSGQHISTNTLYYDKSTGALLKDSLLNRDVDSKTNGQHLNFGFNYSIGLKKPKDSLARQSFKLYLQRVSRIVGKQSYHVCF